MSTTAGGRERAWHQVFLPRAGGVLLGVVLVAAGTLKALDPGLFRSNLPFYGLPAFLEVPVVVLLPAVEIALGTMLLAGWRLRKAALGAATLLVVFAAAIGWGWSRGTLEDCTCFGTMLIRSPGEALRQDLLLLAVAVMTALRAGAPRFFLPRRVGDGIVAGVAILVAAALAVAIATGVREPLEPPEPQARAAAASGAASLEPSPAAERR